MRMADKTARAAPAAFVPSKSVSIDHGPRSGARRVIEKAEPVLLLWPVTMAERRKVVKLWRRIAMKVLQGDGKVMRLPAVIPDCIIWKDGEIWASNWSLSVDAGGCSEKTIQREVEWFRLRGLLSVSYGWRRNQSGQFCRTRLMKLAIPSDYDGQVPSSEDVDHMDTGGPDGDIDQTDTGGPDRMDTGGPVTGRANDSAEEVDRAA